MVNLATTIGNSETMINGGVSWRFGRTSDEAIVVESSATISVLEQRIHQLETEQQNNTKRYDELEKKYNALIERLDGRM